VTLPSHWEARAQALIDAASPREGNLFRSVEMAYAHPDDVVSGEGTRLYGSRFAKPGVRAVYGSADEETALRESAARARRLAGVSIIEYPRVTYVIALKAANCVELDTRNSDAAALLPTCLAPNDLDASQQVGEFFRTHGVQAIGYPSAIRGYDGRNLVVFRDVASPPRIVLVNRDRILEDLRRIAKRL